MSENRVRYFQGRKTGAVVRAATEADALDLDVNPALTEVQVVPLDAVVITEALRIGRGWPTPNHLRRAADALDSFSPAKHGDVLRFVADAADADLARRKERDHPPVDEAQVKALDRLLIETENEVPEPPSWEPFARRLVERGVRVEQP